MNPDEVVYISNIPKSATLADLHAFLKSCGNIVGAAFMRENRNDCRTKIAFVLFETTEQAMEACSLDQTLFQAHRLSVLLSNDDRKFLAGYTIMIENTSSDTSEEDLFEACCRYGNVETVQIPTNYYAFVGFAERSAAHAAQRKLDNAMLKNQKVQVSVLNEDVRVRLEDLDSFKTPRVYNELLRAKQQYYNSHQPTSNPVPTQSVHMEVDYQEQRFDNDKMNDTTNQQFMNDEMDQHFLHETNDFVPVMADANYVEEEYNHLQILRKDVRFGKQRFVPANKTSVKVENVPRDVYDEDVVIYFLQFGPIVSFERGVCMSAIFTKVYTITYQDEASQRRAINCFRRQLTLSGISCTVFTMIPGEAIHPTKAKCVLVSYLSNHVLYDEIVAAFANIGEVLYVEKRVRNNGPTIVHFCHPVNMNDACRISNIAGHMVYVVLCSQKEFQKFANNIVAFRKAVKGNFKGSPKSGYLQEIEAKEEQEKMDNIIFKTVHDPHYRNPDPRKYSFEVVLYNCPLGTTMDNIKNYFKRAAEVLAIRHEPSPFDSSSCKMYVSFGNYLDAFRAIRLKGRLDGEFVYKHVASESPRLDCNEAVRVKVHSEDNVSISRLTRGFSNIGGLYFADKIDINEFVVIFRDMKFAKKALATKKIDKCPAEVSCMRDFIHKKEDLDKIITPTADGNNQNAECEDDEKQTRPFMLLSDMLAINIRKHAPVAPEQIKRISNSVEKTIKPMEKTIKPVEEIPPPVCIKQEKMDPPEAPKATANISNVSHISNVPEIATNRTLPTSAPTEASSDLRNLLLVRRVMQTDCHEKLSDLEDMERVIRVKEMDIRRRLEKLERDEANVTSLLPTRNRSQGGEEISKDSSSTSRRSGGSLWNLSPGRNEDSVTNQRIVSVAPGSTNSASSRLIITQQNRSVSPSDRLAHERYVQIREEKIAITQELDSLRQRFDYRKSSRVGALQDLLAGLDREQRDIQIQLEAKRRFRMQDDLGYNGTSFDNSPTPVERRQRSSRSMSPRGLPYRPLSRSRSRSRQRTRQCTRSRQRTPLRQRTPSRQRARSRHRTRSPQRTRSRHRTRSRSISRLRTRSRSRSTDRSRPARRPRVSRSPVAYRPSRPKRQRTDSRSRSKSPHSVSPQRGSSLERDMYNIGRYHTRHGKFSIYVGNVSSAIQDEELESRFKHYGKLADIDLSRRVRHGEVYFDYENREDAFKALEMNHVKVGGRRLRVAFNMEKPSIREQYSLFFRVRQSVTESHLYRTYEKYGEIDFIWYPEGAKFGAIAFRHAADAKLALVVKELPNGTGIITRPFIDKIKRGV